MSTEAKGLHHPDMTPDLAMQILPEGPRVPVQLLYRLGALLNPMNYRAVTAGELMAIADEMNAALDRGLLAAQAGASSPEVSAVATDAPAN